MYLDLERSNLQSETAEQIDARKTISSDFCLRRRARRFYMMLSTMTVMEYLILREESNEGLAEVFEFVNLEM
jgi:hypothetical protein